MSLIAQLRWQRALQTKNYLLNGQKHGQCVDVLKIREFGNKESQAGKLDIHCANTYP